MVKMIGSSNNSLEVLNLNNVQSVNIGFRELKAVVQCLVDVDISFVMTVVEVTALMVCVKIMELDQLVVLSED
jgi:hypothetical protein